jgi:hypothetical protein
MMGQQAGAQDELFYSFNLDAHVPADPLLRGIDRFRDLELMERGGGLVNTATNEPLRPTDACVSAGIEGGPTPAAAAQTHAHVLTFYKTLFAK